MRIQRLRRILTTGVLVALSALAVSGAWAQTKIKPGFNLFSTEQDLQIGRQSATEVESQLPMLNDRKANAYINAVGQRLAAAMPGTKFPYQFKIVNASDINAFALPGGYMYLNRGLIDAAKNEGQLAGVMAHEMAHVALRHGTNQASKAYMGQAGLGLLGGLLSKDDKTPNKVIGAVGGFGMNALFLKFSRTDEEQADIVGAQAMARAGYDPEDMVDFFEVLSAKQAREPSKVEQFFSSHPVPQGRANRIRSEMKLLTVNETSPVGNLRRTQATLAGMPAAKSMQQIATNQPATASSSARRPVSNTQYGDLRIEVPATSYRTFAHRNGSYQIEYPSNWSPYQSADGFGVTIAPEGGFVDAGGAEKDLIYGVVINHYQPFLNDPDPATDRFSFQGAAGARSMSRTNLADATRDLVGQILRTNPTLTPVADSERIDTIDGAQAISLVLSGRSAVTGEDERVTVFARELSDEDVVYALFIAPGQDYAELKSTFNRMIGSLRVTDTGANR